MIITNDIRYIGVNDHAVDLFEGQYIVPNGMAYNSYAIMDEKIAIMDTVDKNFAHEWLDNIQNTLEGRKPDYLVVQHMEPDHSANIANFLKVYPEAVVVSSAKAFAMMKNFFGEDYAQRRIVVGEVVLDYDAFTVSRGEESQILPQKEFLLLYKLLSYPGKIFTRIQLMDEIWGQESDTGWETVTVHIGRLRKRFEGWEEFEILSVRGLGYKAVKKV